MLQRRSLLAAVATSLLGLSLAALPVTLTASPEAPACSRYGPGGAFEDADVVLIGWGTADTLAAGPGAVRHVGTEAGGTSARDGAIHGQRIRIERIGGPGAGALPAETTDVVVVTWGYDSMCRPVPWQRSALRLPPELRALFVATLREPEHWAGGYPTVDVHNPNHIPTYGGTPSIDELFELYRRLPSRADILEQGRGALEAVRPWVEAHPQLARREPAMTLIGAVMGMIATDELRQTDHPVLGTWRFTVRSDGRISDFFFGRTEAAPTGRWSPSPREQRWAPLVMPRPEGYSFLVSTARSLHDLPATRSERYDHSSAHLYASAEPRLSDDSVLHWYGMVEPTLLARALPEDPRLSAWAREMGRSAAERVRDGRRSEAPARLTVGADGVLRIMQVIQLPDGAELVLEGERLSREVVREGP